MYLLIYYVCYYFNVLYLHVRMLCCILKGIVLFRTTDETYGESKPR